MQAVGEEKTISSDEVPSIQLGCDRTEYWQSSNRHMPFPLSVPVFPFIRQEVKERFLGLPRPSIPHRGHQWTTWQLGSAASERWTGSGGGKVRASTKTRGEGRGWGMGTQCVFAVVTPLSAAASAWVLCTFAVSRSRLLAASVFRKRSPVRIPMAAICSCIWKCTKNVYSTQDSLCSSIPLHFKGQNLTELETKQM